MARLIGLVLSIGLADSMNPATIAPGLYIAAGPRARRDLVQFTLGVFAVYLLTGAILVLGPGEALLALVPHPSHTTRFVLETIAGVAMLIIGTVLWVTRRRLAQRELPDVGAGGDGSSFVLGFTITIVEMPTAFPYLAAVAAIVGSGLNVGEETILYVLYDVCFVAPLLAMIAVVVVAGDRAERILARARDVVQERWPVLLSAVALLVGAFVVTLGVTGLVSTGHSQLARLSRQVHGIISQ